MDFLDWCQRVHEVAVELYRASGGNRIQGIYKFNLAAELWDRKPLEDHHKLALDDALTELSSGGMGSYERDFYKPALRRLDDRLDEYEPWAGYASVDVPDDLTELLEAIVDIGEIEYEDCSALSFVDSDKVLERLTSLEKLEAFARASELADIGMVTRLGVGNGDFIARPTYRGLVHSRRKYLGSGAKLIDALVDAWETTSVDFKRHLGTRTADEKAEFLKDILSLVNTQASGQRYLVIGFDDSTRMWHSAPDPRLKQDHLEQLLTQGTSPIVLIRYECLQYRKDQLVGVIEVLRERHKLPYRVSRSIGDRKRIEEGTVFVRHGSHAEPAFADELLDLEGEGDRARARLIHEEDR